VRLGKAVVSQILMSRRSRLLSDNKKNKREFVAEAPSGSGT
jgi:hypothetical protein